jgi:2-polyprenyl-6-methoxyphenol hydroxylase-like FAD-dependent oxidoreductase
MADIAVIGAGVVGSAAAVLLARRGHEVLLMDSDQRLPYGSADDDFVRWQRPGVPQAAHGHVFRARVTRVLRVEAPDLLSAMLARGCPRTANEFGDGFEDDYCLAARRPVFEAVLGRAVDLQPRVEVRRGVHVRGLTGTDRNGHIGITGVRHDNGEKVAADLVVDCSGRRSGAKRWLAELGVELPLDDHRPCGLHYFARHYRLRPGATAPSARQLIGDVTPYAVFLAFAEDNACFALAGAMSNDDPLRGALRDSDVFDRVLAAVPTMAPWLDVGEAISDVYLMAGLANRHRSLLAGEEPVVLNYVLVGDSSLYTNATVGQGIALGLWQAQTLAHLTEGIDTGAEPARSLEQWTNRVLRPRFAVQATIDAAMVDTMRAGIRGESPPLPLLTKRPLGELAALGGRRRPVRGDGVRPHGQPSVGRGRTSCRSAHS